MTAQSELGVSAPPETGITFVENALLKARHAARATRLPAIADDSGLVVGALGGAPGVRSARFAGERADDGANIAKLLALMADPTLDRSARFHCVLVALDARRRPGAADRIGFVGRAHRARAERHRRLRLRPCLLRSDIAAHGRRVDARRKEPREPPRDGATPFDRTPEESIGWRAPSSGFEPGFIHTPLSAYIETSVLRVLFREKAPEHPQPIEIHRPRLLIVF